MNNVNPYDGSWPRRRKAIGSQVPSESRLMMRSMADAQPAISPSAHAAGAPTELPAGAGGRLFRAQARSYFVPVVLSLFVLTCIGLSAWLFPRNIYPFHASWFLHPNEQEHLTISRHLAKTGSLVIEDPWYGQSPAHGSEDKGYRDGALVPRSSILPYLIFAVPFLITDTAWLWVTPVFGLAAAILAGAIVAGRTGSRAAGTAAGLVLGTTAAVFLNGSGLAIENIIALTFLLAGVLALERAVVQPGLARGALTSALFALAAAGRTDLALAGVIACVLLTYKLMRDGRRGEDLTGQLAGVLGATTVFAATAGVGMVFNAIMYGGPLDTGYGNQAWQGSAEGVAGRFLDFAPAEFKSMAWSFLFQLGKMETALLLAGLGILAWRRRWRAGDIVLLSVAAFLIVLHLGNDRVTGGSQPFLVNSPPRYLQPVYAAGVIIGVEAAWWLFTRSTLAPMRKGAYVALGALTILAVSVNLNEAYATKWGIPSADRDSHEFRQVHEFASQHPGAVFIGDYNTKAIITAHTFIPRLLADPNRAADFIRAELLTGRPVYIVDTPARRDPASGYYSGYLDTLASRGFYVSLVPDTPGFQEVTLPTFTSTEVAGLLSFLLDGPDQLLENPRLETTPGGTLPGWVSNGDSWFEPRVGGGILIRNTAQYGGIRQVIPGELVSGQTVSAFVAVKGAPEHTAERFLLGLYDDATRTPIVEAYTRIGETTTYLVIEASIPQDSRPLRLAVASDRQDPGDFVIHQVALVRGSTAEVLDRYARTP